MERSNYKLLDGGMIITMDEARHVFKNGAVLIKDNIISKIGTCEEINKYVYENNIEPQIIDTKSSVVMPGLVCNHTHLFQSLYRGLGENLSVLDWCVKMIFPMSKYMGEEEAYAAGMLAQMELIRTGTTTFADSHYIHVDKRAMDGLAESVKQMGSRGVLVRATQSIPFNPSFPLEFLEDKNTIEKETLRCIQQYNGALNGRLKMVPEAITDLDVDPDILKMLHDIGKEYGVGLHMHTAESTGDVAVSLETRGKRAVEWLYEEGILDENTLLAHCVWVTPKELGLLAHSGAKVAHNPVSNLMLGDGIAPLPYMLEMGIDVGIGVDGACSNNSQDMFDAMKICLLEHRGKWTDPGILKPEDVLELATISSAKTLRMDREIGSLEEGKKADITIVGLKQIQMTPNLKPVANLVLASNGYNVDTVIIDGEIILENKKFKKIKEEEIIETANRAAGRMLKKAGLENLMTDGRFNYI